MKKHSLPFALALSLCFLFPGLAEATTGNDNPTGVTGSYNGEITTGGSYDPYTGNAKRFVTDLTVTGSVGAYPLKWTRVLNTRDARPVALGQGGTWRHSYQWGLWVRPPPPYHYHPDPYEGPDGAVSYPDGRTMELHAETDGTYRQASGAEAVDRLENRTDGFDLVLKDGGRVKFFHSTPNSTSGHDLIAKEIVDPYGQTTHLERDTAGRLSKIIEPAGRYLLITYDTKSYPYYWPLPGGTHYVDVISRVEAFAGPGSAQPTETVSYHYESEQIGSQLTYYYLTHVDYADNTHATYTYFPSSAAAGQSAVAGRIHTCDDARFAGAMSKIEYVYATPGQGYPVGIGQIKGEKYPGTSTFVSEVIYPPSTPNTNNPSQYVRTEKRADGASRSF